MASMREIKLRIKSIKEIRQITKAMNLIAASKLKKARYQLEQTLPYFEKVKSTIVDILTHSASVESVFFDLKHEKEGNRKAYIIISGDKSLAGSYNHNINKFAEEHIDKSSDSLLFIAGMMGKNYFTRKKYNVVQEFDYSVQNPTVYRVREIAEWILNLFKSGEVGEVFIIYTFMESSVKLEPHIMKLLPLDLEALKQEVENMRDSNVKLDENLIYEPSPQAVLDILIPKYVKGIIYGTFVEAFASEQSAKMIAMDNSTSNADETLHKLNLHYNRARQAAITQEITEIVGGAEALK